MTKTEELLARIDKHEAECAVRYEMINKQLDEGAKRFDKLRDLYCQCIHSLLLVCSCGVL